MFNQYADALRRLTNTQSSSLGGPQAMGGADVAKPMGFGAPAPQQPSALDAPKAMGGADVAQPSILQPPQPQQAAAGGNPIGIEHLVNGASKKEAEHVTKQLEQSGVNVDDKYNEVQQKAGLPKEPKLSRHEKGMRIMEFGLRLMAASRDNDLGTAIGIAGGGLMDSIRARKDKEQTDAERRANRAEDVGLKKQEITSRETISTAEQAGANKRASEQNTSAEKIAGMAAARQKEGNMRPFTDKSGKQWTYDAQGNAVPVTGTTMVDESIKGTGGRGRKPMTRKVSKKTQLEAAARTDKNGLDQDTVQRLMQDEAKALREDVKNRRLTDEEINKKAHDNVMARIAAGSGGGNVVDWNDLQSQ